uniref:Uncharacterized protein n=1 Tax=Anguilla anguilla TaxID=7936 RepID=A0A0E9WIH4_ANGAN
MASFLLLQPITVQKSHMVKSQFRFEFDSSCRLTGWLSAGAPLLFPFHHQNCTSTSNSYFDYLQVFMLSTIKGFPGKFNTNVILTVNGIHYNSKSELK